MSSGALISFNRCKQTLYSKILPTLRNQNLKDYSVSRVLWGVVFLYHQSCVEVGNRVDFHPETAIPCYYSLDYTNNFEVILRAHFKQFPKDGTSTARNR